MRLIRGCFFCTFSLVEKKPHTDRFIVYLRKALLLSRLSRREESIENALLSIAGFRWNWSAWTLLASCIADGEEVVWVYSIDFISDHHFSYHLWFNWFLCLRTIPLCRCSKLRLWMNSTIPQRTNCRFAIVYLVPTSFRTACGLCRCAHMPYIISMVGLDHSFVFLSLLWCY